MSDVDKLQNKLERGELLLPDPERLNVVDLSRALNRLAGGDAYPLSRGSARIVDLVGQSDHLIFILADGLGLNLIEKLPDRSFLARHLVAELRSIFPSTTASVLTTFATGAWPAQHGVTGQWTHLAEIRGAAALLPFAARSGGRLLLHLGVTVEGAFPVPASMSALSRDVLALLPSRIVSSVSSAYFSGQQARIGYESLADVVRFIVARVADATAPTYTYLYSPRIDTECHYLGLGHPDVLAIVNELSRIVEQLANGLKGRARIVVAADHGMLDAPVSARHGFKPSADIFDALRFGPSGDDRVLYFHLREGADERFRRRITAQYGDRFFVITIAEAEQLRLFGPDPIALNVRDRFGDLVMISSGEDMIEYAPGGHVGHRVDLNSFHSGLSPDEMRVPLIVI
ncbi:MAG TPA: alkaline phosphatase family protein [Chloroflexota bacterium]|nr:alkaline phosphatase family protein [Chloroflexota bacterium]